MEIVIPYLARSATGTITIDGIVYQVPLLDSSGRQIVVGIGAGGAIEAIQDTPADLKTAVHGLDGATQRQIVVDSSGRQIVVGIGAGGAIEAIQDTPADLKAAIHGIDGATQRQIVVDSSGRIMPTDIRERNPVMITAQYAADNIAPHGLTQRWIYTVPAAKKAIVESLYTMLGRSVVGAPGAMAFARIQLTPSGVASAIISESRIYTNVVGDKWIVSLACNLLMCAGDVMSGITIDQSTGGTFSYIITMKATQFDA